MQQALHRIIVEAVAAEVNPRLAPPIGPRQLVPKWLTTRFQNGFGSRAATTAPKHDDPIDDRMHVGCTLEQSPQNAAPPISRVRC